jgi:ribonuclease BN (tRNA processing enzyme)
VRGSTPSPGAAFVRYGGSTSCLAVSHDDGPPTLILDGGTGLQRVAELALGDRPFVGSVLLGHLHWDHTHGLPFFPAAMADGARTAVLLPAQPGVDAEDVLASAFAPPHFPVRPSELGPGWSFGFVDEGEQEVERFAVLAREIPHKGGRTLGYRITSGSATLAYVTDHSPTSLGPGPSGYGELHDAVLELAKGADVLVHDAQHLASEFPRVDYLGHAAVEYAVELAEAAGARTVVLFHHAPGRTDDELDEIAGRCWSSSVEVVVAREGLVLDL